MGIPGLAVYHWEGYKKRKIIMKYVKYVEKLRVLMIPIIYFQKNALKNWAQN